jgi:hypothetical protein
MRRSTSTRLRAHTGTQHNILSRKALSFALRSESWAAMSGTLAGVTSLGSEVVLYVKIDLLEGEPVSMSRGG